MMEKGDLSHPVGTAEVVTQCLWRKAYHRRQQRQAATLPVGITGLFNHLLQTRMQGVNSDKAQEGQTEGRIFTDLPIEQLAVVPETEGFGSGGTGLEQLQQCLPAGEILGAQLKLLKLAGLHLAHLRIHGGNGAQQLPQIPARNPI
ncbi:hypothetical protein [Aeromonas caviae]|uniref:hypothetical protein n=1 Tax=Aeromonas caviae TaxID=648 RepID=UPI0013A5BB1B|nr:hypothetical protein [Aeromonas caviae]